jgi:hypothetical protein
MNDLKSVIRLNSDGFIEESYKLILGRICDEEGKKTYLSLLSDGLSKEEVIANLYNSTERKKTSIKVSGIKYLIVKVFILRALKKMHPLRILLNLIYKKNNYAISKNLNNNLTMTDTAYPEKRTIILNEADVNSVFYLYFNRSPENNDIVEHQLLHNKSKNDLFVNLISPEFAKNNIELIKSLKKNKF